jgi:hypothetical protein
MTGELILKIDKTLIEKTTEYAALRGLSLARLVESYLTDLIREEPEEPQATGVVAELAGLLEGVELGDAKGEYAQYLARKYS